MFLNCSDSCLIAGNFYGSVLTWKAIVPPPLLIAHGLRLTALLGVFGIVVAFLSCFVSALD